MKKTLAKYIKVLYKYFVSDGCVAQVVRVSR